jgi:hypothetical protein
MSTRFIQWIYWYWLGIIDVHIYVSWLVKLTMYIVFLLILDALFCEMEEVKGQWHPLEAKGPKNIV